MVEKKSIAIMTAGSGAGIAQTFIVREYVDKVYGPIPGLEGLGGFGTYSAMGGIIGGGITTALGLVSVLTGKITNSEMIQMGLIGYGIPALSGGILSGLFPTGGGLRVPAGRAPAGKITLTSAGPARSNTGRVPPAAGRVPAGQTGIPLRT